MKDRLLILLYNYKRSNFKLPTQFTMSPNYISDLLYEYQGGEDLYLDLYPDIIFCGIPVIAEGTKDTYLELV